MWVTVDTVRQGFSMIMMGDRMKPDDHIVLMHWNGYKISILQ